MASTAPVYGRGYEPAVHAGNLPYYYTYNYDYDFPIPNPDDPRWEKGLELKRYAVYAPAEEWVSKDDTTIRLPIVPQPSPAPNPPIHQKRPFRLGLLLFGLAFLALLLVLAASGAPDRTW